MCSVAVLEEEKRAAQKEREKLITNYQQHIQLEKEQQDSKRKVRAEGRGLSQQSNVCLLHVHVIKNAHGTGRPGTKVIPHPKKKGAEDYTVMYSLQVPGSPHSVCILITFLYEANKKNICLLYNYTSFKCSRNRETGKAWN